MNSSRSIAAARQRRAGDQPVQRPNTSIASSQAFQQQPSQMPRRMQGQQQPQMTQQQKFSPQQSQQYQQGAFSEFQDPTVAAENAKDEARRDLEAQAAKGNVKAQQALDNLGKPSMDPKIVKSKAKVEYMQKQGFTWSALKGKWVKAGTGFLGFGAQVASKEDLDKAEAASSLAVPQTISKQTSDSVYNQSAENDTAKLNSKDTSQNNIVNAPTTINKQTQNTIMKTPIRSQETSIRSYYRSRFST
jgi:hypothetical protein